MLGHCWCVNGELIIIRYSGDGRRNKYVEAREKDELLQRLHAHPGTRDPRTGMTDYELYERYRYRLTGGTRKRIGIIADTCGVETKYISEWLEDIGALTERETEKLHSRTKK